MDGGGGVHRQKQLRAQSFPPVCGSPVRGCVNDDRLPSSHHNHLEIGSAFRQVAFVSLGICKIIIDD